ncbi:MAG: 3-isopropylmalate dehydratase small subunit [Pseudomonadota bacterium]
MAGISRVKGVAVALAMDNIDTDQLIPARFMSAPRSAGYGGFLLHDLRRTDDGALDPAFPLNTPAADGAKILVAGRNFGSGSSREAAVYALVDAGIRAVVAESFGDIFRGNAVNNGLIPAEVERVAPLLGTLTTPGAATLDIATRSLTVGTVRTAFALSDVFAKKLRNGWDDIDLTLGRLDAIAAFRRARHEGARWAFPNHNESGPNAAQPEGHS